MVNPQELVRLIVWLAGERGERLTTLRLVKFLYLADLYFARENGGLTLTGWPWAFIHFGPFCGEAVAAIDAAEKQGSISAQKFASKYNDKDFRIFSIDDHEPPRLRETLAVYVLGPLQEAIRRWGDDTPGLLDHVYFHTEPMIEARPRQRLDFSRAVRLQEPRPVEMLRLDRQKLHRAREATKALAEQYKQGLEARRRADAEAVYDDAFGAAVRAMEDGKVTEGGEVTGTAEIRED